MDRNEEVEGINEMDKSEPSPGRDSDIPFPKPKPIKLTKDKQRQASDMAKQLTKNVFPNVKHFTSKGNPDWKKHGLDMPTEEVEMFEAVDPVEARDILKKHGGADEDFYALPSEHKNSLHHLAYKFKHNPGKGASGSRARMFHAHLKRQAAKADKAQADVQKLTKEEHDYEYEMARNQLTTASRSIERLMGMLKGEGNLEAWVQSKLTMAADYLDTVADYMESDKKN
jgi:hypothetical protein